MRESRIEQALRLRAADYGFLALKFVSPQKAGVPDRVLITPHGTVFIELKAPGQKPRPLQNRVMAEMARSGARLYLIDNLDAVETLLAALATGDETTLDTVQYHPPVTITTPIARP